MVAILDERPAGPRTHVFVLGVSRYRHLEDGSEPTQAGIDSNLEQLTSAARSASEFAAWVLGEYRNPSTSLASLFVCLAPSEDEAVHAEVRARLGAADGATRSVVMADWLEFRRRCRAERDATAIVYVAGHGVQLTADGAIVLLEDYAGDGQEAALWAAFDMKGLHESLAGSTAAARQFWFVDSCRQRPEVARQFESLQGAFGGDRPVGEVEASPLFLASGPRGIAWARTHGVSLFNEALLRCLRCDAAVGPKHAGGSWRVTTASLAEKLRPLVLEASGSAQQVVQLTGLVGTTAEVLHVFPQPPTAELTLGLSPPAAEPEARAALFRGNTKVLEHDAAWPLVRKLAAGLYRVSVLPRAPYAETQEIISVEPPASRAEVEVAS
ncbi:MAG: hypothetical protein IT373_25210 [Polyangiaceae bacterium]|nr:hypothetical protein [Polyangiaceae bacterium]